MKKMKNKWCCKPNNEEEALIISKWVDENQPNSPGDKTWYQKNYNGTDCYWYVIGEGNRNVYHSNPIGIIYTFEEFKNKFVDNIEQYEIF